MLAAYNVKTFYSALDRLTKGYYEDSITLTRGLYETFVRTLFISCHPDDAYNALIFKPPKGERAFNLTNFLRNELGLEWETKYGVMSTFAHSNSLQVLSALQRALEVLGLAVGHTLRQVGRHVVVDPRVHPRLGVLGVVKVRHFGLESWTW